MSTSNPPIYPNLAATEAGPSAPPLAPAGMPQPNQAGYPNMQQPQPITYQPNSLTAQAPDQNATQANGQPAEGAKNDLRYLDYDEDTDCCYDTRDYDSPGCRKCLYCMCVCDCVMFCVNAILECTKD